MFVINEDKSIYITRGDVAFFSIEAKTDIGEKYKFMPGDVVRFKVFERKACENVVLSKDFGIETESEEVSIYLEEKDTKFGEVISKPVEYWYEVELNPYTDPQTILGYDEDGAKVFKLFPEGNEKEDDDPITPEDIPVVDSELDLTSTRPVQNQAIARAFLKINEDIDARMLAVEDEAEKLMGEIREGSIDYLTDAKGHKVTNVGYPTESGDAVNLGYIWSYHPYGCQFPNEMVMLWLKRDNESTTAGEYVLDETNPINPTNLTSRINAILSARSTVFQQYKCKVLDNEELRFYLYHCDTGEPLTERDAIVGIELYYIPV